MASLEPGPMSPLSNPEPLPPRYPIEDVFRLVNPDIRKAFDMKEVVLRLVDDSRLSIFKPKYGPNLMTAWAHIMGRSVAANCMHMADTSRLPGWYRGKPGTNHQPQRGIQGSAVHPPLQPTVRPDSSPMKLLA